MRPLFVAIALLAIPVWGVLAYLAVQPKAPAVPASPVDGIVVRVDAAGLADIHSFDLRIAGGTVVTFRLGTLENPTGFSPSHLAVLQATSSPIRAWFRQDGSDLVVYRLEDVPD
jgi:hypothetical protein